MWRYTQLVLISIAIGTGFLYAFSPECVFNIRVWLPNAGYSIMLGFGLFHNGLTLKLLKGRHISWIKHPARTALYAIVIMLIYSTIVIFIVNWIWFVLIPGISIRDFLFSYGKTIIFYEYIMLLVIGSIEYAKSFFHEWRMSIYQQEALKREALQLQYQVLNHQVNPHFLFNSLNVLNSLIDINPLEAKVFVADLSAFYRELLGFKEKEIVRLEEEIHFLDRYLKLQQKRFGDKLKFEIDTNGTDGCLISMTLQMLAENAIKHNIISTEKPLTFKVRADRNGYLVAENNLQKKEVEPESSFIGLKNLKERYLYLTGKELLVDDSNGMFSVKIPLIEIENDQGVDC